jgi:peptidoglycan hydrolase-like protein with peptidoglycan-binding domain
VKAQRDLAVPDLWLDSLERSRARRRHPHGTGMPLASPPTRPTAVERTSVRDLSFLDPWQTSLARSKARREAAVLEVQPPWEKARSASGAALAALAANPARNASVAAIAALAASPAGSLGSGGGGPTTLPSSLSMLSPDDGAEVTEVEAAAAARPDEGRELQTARALGTHQPRLRPAVNTAPARTGTASEETEVPKPASKPERIAMVQRTLQVVPDGDFGPKTAAAVRKFQARRGLIADGLVGPATWAALELNSPYGGVLRARAIKPPKIKLQRAASRAEGERTIRQRKPSPSEPRATLAARRENAEQARAEQARQAQIAEEQAAERRRAAAAERQRAAEQRRRQAAQSGSNSVVARVIAAANRIATTPYIYGGGHGSFDSAGYDCSGSVSYALHGGGLLGAPMASSGFMSYGAPGPGRRISIYANPGHVYMVVDGRRFDTSARRETGNRWSSTGRGSGGYVVRHPPGY